MSDDVKTLTDATFDEDVTKADRPCHRRLLGALVRPLSHGRPDRRRPRRTHADKVTVGKLNVDENQATAAKFGIMSIPTIILFKDGKADKKVIGVRSKGDLEKEFGLV